MNLETITKMIQRATCLATAGFMALGLVSCGGGGGSPGTVAGSSGSTSTTPATVSLLFSSPDLPSSGATGTDVTVTALVKNADNNAIPSVPVTFSADSGALTAVQSATDANGKATAVLSTSGDRSNRKITITVRAGNISTTGTVNVTGTTVAVNGPSAITAGGTGDFTISVKDSANVAVPNVPVTISSAKGNTISIKSSGGGTASAPLTNSQGLVEITVSGSQAGSDTLTISAQGVSAAKTFTVNAVKLTVTTLDSSGGTVSTVNTSTTCTRIAAHYENAGVPQSGNINISTSRGNLYSDSACTAVLGSSSIPVTAGDAQATYIKSDTAGVATITAAVVNGPTAQTNLEFVAALTSSATISLQSEPAVIGTGERSLLSVIVRDGTSYNNLVKGAVVEFTIVNDPSGGTLSNPSVVTTESNGSASVYFNAGSASTPEQGVTVQARIQGTNKTATTALTVSRKSLFISAGTGNNVVTASPTTYRMDYTVFVTDASGNPVPNVSIVASAIPTQYRKGTLVYASGAWRIGNTVYTCANEDLNKDGVLDPGEDYNNNGMLDPGIPLSVTSSATTDSSGTAVVSILYPRDRAVWTDVKMTIRGTVVGTESTYTTSFGLVGASSDYTSENTAPPGVISPYGVNPCNVAN